MVKTSESDSYEGVTQASGTFVKDEGERKLPIDLIPASPNRNPVAISQPYPVFAVG